MPGVAVVRSVFWRAIKHVCIFVKCRVLSVVVRCVAEWVAVLLMLALRCMRVHAVERLVVWLHIVETASASRIAASHAVSLATNRPCIAIPCIMAKLAAVEALDLPTRIRCILTRLRSSRCTTVGIPSAKAVRLLTSCIDLC